MLTSVEAEQVKVISEQTGSIAALLYGNPMGPMSFGQNSTIAQDLFGFLLLAYSWEQTMKNPENYSVSPKKKIQEKISSKASKMILDDPIFINFTIKSSEPSLF